MLNFDKKVIDILHENEENFRLIANMIPDILWTALPDGYEDFHNTKYTEYTGLSQEEAEGFGWEKAVHPDDLKNVRIKWAECIKSGKSYQIEYRIRSFEGKYKWFLTRAIPWRDEDGFIIKWFGTITDIDYGKTMRINLLRTTEELTKTNAQLSKVNNILNHFVYIAAHDLNAPINNIKMLFNLVKAEKDSSKKDQLISYIENSVYRLERTVGGLLEIIQSENEESTVSTLLFKEIINIVISDLSVIYPDISKLIVYDLEECPSINYVRPYIVSIIKNLISNSYKYRSKDRTLKISIKTRKENEFKVVSISDNGMGFNMETSGDILGPFKRLTNVGEGKGIGLFVINNIVQKNGGKIEYFSQEGVGTTFSVFLKEYTIT